MKRIQFILTIIVCVFIFLPILIEPCQCGETMSISSPGDQNIDINTDNQSNKFPKKFNPKNLEKKIRFKKLKNDHRQKVAINNKYRHESYRFFKNQAIERYEKVPKDIANSK